ncbi:MAG TPA: response regulator [Bacillota bacterium]|nr:response regulator [Bacillota bacterium]HPE37927.1 response regulator [Bacillota bacterium]
MKRKVLIVDDSVINRDILESILSNDYDLLMAENGEEALAILNESAASISAVLLDLMMPVMDGYQVLFVMRKDPVLTKIPVLVMTGRSEEEAEVRVLSEGAKDFIAKPYNREVIKHRLRNTITLRETAAMINAVERDDLTDLYSKNFFYHNIQNLLHTTTAISYDMICFDIIRFHMINELFGEKLVMIYWCILQRTLFRCSEKMPSADVSAAIILPYWYRIATTMMKTISNR